MIDSRDKRASILGLALAALAILPVPAGTLIDAGSRAQLAYSYNSESAAPTPPTPEPPQEQIFGIVPGPVRRPVLVSGRGAVMSATPAVSGSGTVEPPRPILLVAQSSPHASVGSLFARGTVARPALSAAVSPESPRIEAVGGVYHVRRKRWNA